MTETPRQAIQTRALSRRAAVTLLALGAPASAAAEGWGDILGGILGGQSSGAGGAKSILPGFTAAEADKALREALTVGAGNVVMRLGKLDGFFKDPKVKIPLPKSLREVQSTLSTFGMSGALDDLELKLNRGAETAVPKAKTLFVTAIKAMTVEDAIGIVRGGETAGTDYLKGKTEDSLTTAFSPPMKSALTSVGALKAADKAAKTMAKYGYKRDFRGELTSYAVGYALDGMFLYLGEEEKAIRKDPVKRTSEILKKVFGAV
jgi:hypothetical protein